MWEQTLAVIVVLGLLVGSLWLLRRKGFASVKLGFGASHSRRLELVERMALTPQHSLHLVRVEDRLLLIGLSPQSCASLAAFPAAANGVPFSLNQEGRGL